MIASEKTTRFQKLLKEKNISSALIFNFVDIFYFTGTIHGNVLYIPAEGESLLFTRRAVVRSKEEIETGQAVPFSSFK